MPPVTEPSLHPLGHLPQCPDCKFYVSALILCKGARKPEHVDFWYRHCLNNCPPFVTTCEYFDWDKTGIPHGREGYSHIDKQCRGIGCAASTRPKEINLQCIFALCKQCCLQAHEVLTDIRPCSVTDHRPKRTAARTRLSTSVAQPPTSTSAAGGGIVSSLSATPTSSASGPPPLVVNPAVLSTPASAPRYQPVEKTHKVSMTADYVELIKNIQAQHVSTQEDADNEARLQHENSHNVQVSWWHENDCEPQMFEVRVKQWPAFHPHHCPELVDAFDLKSKGFQYFDRSSRAWFTGSTNSPARNVKTCGPLYYRTKGVTRGEGMPGMTNPLKRVADVLDSDSEAHASPKRTLPSTPSHYYAPRTPQSTHNRMARRAISTPTATPSRARKAAHHVVSSLPLSRESSVTSTPSKSPSVMSSFGSSGGRSTVSTPARTPTALSRASSVMSSRSGRSSSPNDIWGFVDETPQHGQEYPSRSSSPPSSEFYAADFDLDFPVDTGPLPPLFPQLLEARDPASSAHLEFNFDFLSDFPPVMPGSPSASSSVGQPSRSDGSDLLNGSPVNATAAPLGPSGFPLRYVCDMAERFDTMASLRADGVKKEIAFQLAFELPYKKSTVTDNLALWTTAAAIHGEQARWISYGRSERGEWGRFKRAMEHA